MSPPILSDIGVQSVDLICWFTPERWRPGRLFILAGEVGADKVYRMSISLKEGQLSLLLDHYLRDTPDSVEHCSERIELGLFTRDEITWALQAPTRNDRRKPVRPVSCGTLEEQKTRKQLNLAVLRGLNSEE